MSKQNPLVLEHLEDISWRVLEEYPHLIRKMIRRRAGIYVLYRKNNLYYVGLANNLMGRLKTHLRDRHRGYWDRFSVYLTIHDEHMKELESLLLRITGPSGNKTGGKFAKALNLMPTLYRAMKDNDADRYARLLGGTIARRRLRVKTKQETGTVPLAGVVDRRIVLAAIYNDKRYRAVLRKDGMISFANRRYKSPSAAARAATRTSINGWLFWQYRDKGKWKPLDEIRK